jgi:hypothetical protein
MPKFVVVVVVVGRGCIKTEGIAIDWNSNSAGKGKKVIQNVGGETSLTRLFPSSRI